MSDIKTVLETAKTQMEKTISHLEMELAKIRAGKANPTMHLQKPYHTRLFNKD